MTSSSVPLLPATERSLLHRIAVGQSEGRTPSLVGAIARGGRMVWAGAWGDVASATDTQYRVGSITKTFTAVLVMRLRDEGVLGLEDPLEKHLPGTGVGGVTIAQFLSHTAGLSAESPAPWWERTPGGLRPGLADVLGERPFAHPPGRGYHYSNTGYALLGSLVSAVRGIPWEEALRAEILEPLGMHRTTSQPVAPYAKGWAVHPWADVLLPEPAEDLGLMAPAGQLWSTTADLCRFASFLAGGDARVLSAESVREMRTPAAPPIAESWDGGYGLGVQLIRRDGLTLVGHSGSLPGFVAGLWLSVDDDVAAVVLANATSGPQLGALVSDLVRIVVEAEPRFPEPWRPLPEDDAPTLCLTGSWYWGTYAYGLKALADGGVELQPLRDVGRGSRFRPLPDGTWLGLDGYYDGEVLRVVRREDGSVSHLDLGSFVFTREPYGPEDAVPGGVDEGGWRGAR